MTRHFAPLTVVAVCWTPCGKASVASSGFCLHLNAECLRGGGVGGEYIVGGGCGVLELISGGFMAPIPREKRCMEE